MKMKTKPLVLDFFCGLGGWTEAFLAEGYRAIGFDIEAHDYGTGGYPGELVLRDICSITGGELVKQYGVPACIVASPPCQEFSYMAMPWSLAKEKRRKIKADPMEQARLTKLFNECFRIQMEIIKASGHHVPMVVENVRGAQEWVGKAKWNFGSFFLWGDVPALMPVPCKFRKTSEGSWDTNRGNYNPQDGGKAMNISMTYAELKNQFGTKGYATRLGESQFSRMYSSKSKQRKQASAEIAKIPVTLAQWIAKVFKPKTIA